MTMVKVPARDLIAMISDGLAVPTWIEIGGLNTHTHNQGENEEATDTTTYASQGHYEQVIMQRGASMECEGVWLKDDVTGVLDPGQDRCEDLGNAVAIPSLGKIRFRHPTDTEWKVWECTASLGEQGGGNNDMKTWKCTFTRSGPTTTMAVV